MTIFLDVAKKILTKKLIEIKQSSQNLDHWTTKLPLKILRNHELSGGKRELISQLEKHIQSTANQENDEESLTKLITHVDLCLANMRVLRQKHGEGIGKTEPKLQDLQALLREILKKLSALKLNNIKQTEDPLYHFQFQVAYYSARNLITLNQTHWPSKLNLLSSPIPFITAQQALVDNCLAQCIHDVSLLNASDEDYENTKRRHVLLVIRGLQQDNRALAKKHTTQLLIAAEMTNPDNGSLEKYMLRAIDNIEVPSTKKEQLLTRDYISCDIASASSAASASESSGSSQIHSNTAQQNLIPKANDSEDSGEISPLPSASAGASGRSSRTNSYTHSSSTFFTSATPTPIPSTTHSANDSEDEDSERGVPNNLSPNNLSPNT